VFWFSAGRVELTQGRDSLLPCFGGNQHSRTLLSSEIGLFSGSWRRRGDWLQCLAVDFRVLGPQWLDGVQSTNQRDQAIGL
jgi:hypothetical protein